MNSGHFENTKCIITHFVQTFKPCLETPHDVRTRETYNTRSNTFLWPRAPGAILDCMYMHICTRYTENPKIWDFFENANRFTIYRETFRLQNCKLFLMLIDQRHHDLCSDMLQNFMFRIFEETSTYYLLRVLRFSVHFIQRQLWSQRLSHDKIFAMNLISQPWESNVWRNQNSSQNLWESHKLFFLWNQTRRAAWLSEKEKSASHHFPMWPSFILMFSFSDRLIYNCCRF